VGSFVIRLAQHSIPGMLQKDASFYLKLHLIGFMTEVSGSYIMKRVLPPGCFIVCSFDSDLPPRGSSRHRRAPCGGRPNRFFSFDHVRPSLPERQAAWAIHKAGVVFVGASIIGGAIFRDHGFCLTIPTFVSRFGSTDL